MNISINQLSIHVGDQTLFDGISTSFSGVGVTSIMGPTGCGKSTLIAAMTRLLGDGLVLSGQILIDGKAIEDWSPVELRRRIALVLQRPTFFRGTAMSNLSKVIELRGLAHGADAITLATESLKRVGLWNEPGVDLVGRPVSDLSGGQQQRLSIARSTVLNPDAILLDEPTSALDPEAAKRVADVISDLGRERLVVIVTHDPLLAEQVSDRVILLHRDPDGGTTHILDEVIAQDRHIDWPVRPDVLNWLFPWRERRV